MSPTDAPPEAPALRPRRGGLELRLEPGRQRLSRARRGRVLTGLCAGVASFVGYPVGAVRAVFVVVALLTLGTAALAYLALSALVPAAPEQP